MSVKIRCHYDDCQYLDEEYCSAAQIELTREGCRTYLPSEESSAEVDIDETDEEADEWEELEDEDEEEGDEWNDDGEKDEF